MTTIFKGLNFSDTKSALHLLKTNDTDSDAFAEKSPARKIALLRKRISEVNSSNKKLAIVERKSYSLARFISWVTGGRFFGVLTTATVKESDLSKYTFINLTKSEDGSQTEGFIIEAKALNKIAAIAKQSWSKSKIHLTVGNQEGVSTLFTNLVSQLDVSNNSFSQSDLNHVTNVVSRVLFGVDDEPNNETLEITINPSPVAPNATEQRERSDSARSGPAVSREQSVSEGQPASEAAAAAAADAAFDDAIAEDDDVDKQLSAKQQLANLFPKEVKLTGYLASDHHQTTYDQDHITDLYDTFQHVPEGSFITLTKDGLEEGDLGSAGDTKSITIKRKQYLISQSEEYLIDEFIRVATKADNPDSAEDLLDAVLAGE